MVNQITTAGMDLLLRGLTGELIDFTKIKLGNGQDPGKDATELSNPLMVVEISKATRNADHVTLTGIFKNTEVTDGFSAMEIGVFAKDPTDDSKEILYAYWYEEDEIKADYVPASTDRILETQVDVLVFVGEAQNVTATLSSSLVYASAADLKAHIENYENPHKVTAKQVGLDQVENKPMVAITPLYEVAEQLEELADGDTMGTILGKLKAGVAALIAHLKNTNNPHKTTPALIGAAAKTHYHSASQINSGTLLPARGGTGVASIAALAEVLGPYFHVPVFGTYVGDGTQKRLIPLDFKPAAVLVMNSNGMVGDDVKDGCGGLAVGTMGVKAPNCTAEHDVTWSDSHTVLMISQDDTAKGFYVNYSSSYAMTNKKGDNFVYIAFKEVQV